MGSFRCRSQEPSLTRRRLSGELSGVRAPWPWVLRGQGVSFWKEVMSVKSFDLTHLLAGAAFAVATALIQYFSGVLPTLHP